MANTFTGAIDNLTVPILDHWSNTCVMPGLITNDYDPTLSPMHRGKSIDLFDIDDMSAVDVEEVIVPTTFSDVTTKNRQLSLDYWKEVRFQLTDRDWSNINMGVLPLSMEEAMTTLSEAIDASIYTEAKKYAYNFVGTAGTTPFGSDMTILSEAARRLSTGKAPKTNRYLALNEFAMQNARNLTQFREADKAGTQETLRTGEVGEAYGFMFAESNNVPFHTTTASGTYAIDTAGSAGNTTITIDNGAGALPTALVVGDVLSIVGSTQQYVVTSYTAGTTDAVVGIFPELDQTIADGDSVTVAASHRLNLAFHRSSIAFASRKIAGNLDQTGGVQKETIADPKTGIVLDFVHQSGWAVDVWGIRCLWGVVVPPLKEGGIVRILG